MSLLSGLGAGDYHTLPAKILENLGSEQRTMLQTAYDDYSKQFTSIVDEFIQNTKQKDPAAKDKAEKSFFEFRQSKTTILTSQGLTAEKVTMLFSAMPRFKEYQDLFNALQPNTFARLESKSETKKGNQAPVEKEKNSPQEVEKLAGTLTKLGLSDSDDKDYRKEDTTTAKCFSFHVLLKMAICDSYLLPKLEDCTFTSLVDGIKTCFHEVCGTDTATLAQRIRIIELVLCQVESPEFRSQVLLKLAQDKEICNFILNEIKKTAFEEWPNKGLVMARFLHVFPENNEAMIKFAIEINHFPGACKRTAAIGFVLYSIMVATTVKSQYEFVCHLRTLLPLLAHHDITDIFRIPFPSFKDSDVPYKDPDFVCRLGFNSTPTIYVHKNSLIGTFWNREDKKWIVACDTATENPIWAIPLKTLNTNYIMTAFGIAVIEPKNSVITIYNPENGEKVLDVTLPIAIQADDAEFTPSDSIHITGSGFCYFQVNAYSSKIYGGQISNGKWEQVFVLDQPKGTFFTSMGNFLCCADTLHNVQFIIDQTGKIHEFQNCRNLFIKGNKLFKIETSPETQQKCVISMQNIEEGNVFKRAGSKKKFPIKPQKAQLMAVCDDDTIIIKALLSNSEHLCFVNFAKKQFSSMKLKHDLYGELFFDLKKNTIWFWSKDDEILWKHSQTTSQKLGLIKVSTGMTFHHVDDDDKVYFSAIPLS